MPVDGALGFGDLLVDTPHCAPRTVIAVLVVDDPIRDPARLLTDGGRPGLGEHLPIGDCFVGVCVAPFAHHIGYEWDAASATTVTSVSWWAALNALITGSMVAVSALLPPKASTANGNPAASVSSPMVICGSRRLSA
jgi:hypothetical protein